MKITQGLVASISMAGITLPLSRGFILNGSTGTSNGYNTLYRNSVPYQVPTGKKLVVVATRVLASAGEVMYVGYGDTTSITSAAPTNAVTQSLGALNLIYITGSANGAGGENEVMINLEVPAGKYPYMLKGASANQLYASFLCYLVDV